MATSGSLSLFTVTSDSQGSGKRCHQKPVKHCLDIAPCGELGHCSLSWLSGPQGKCCFQLLFIVQTTHIVSQRKRAFLIVHCIISLTLNSTHGYPFISLSLLVSDGSGEHRSILPPPSLLLFEWGVVMTVSSNILLTLLFHGTGHTLNFTPPRRHESRIAEDWGSLSDWLNSNLILPF